MFKPHGTLIAMPVKPIGSGWVPSGRIMLIAPVVSGGSDVVQHGLGDELELLHDGRAVGDLRRREFQIHELLATQTLPFESSARARTPIPARKVSTLDGSSAGKPHDGVRRRVADPDAILSVDDDVEGRLQPRDLDDAALLHSSAGEVQQLVVRAIGNPDVTVRGDTDAHQAEESSP